MDEGTRGRTRSETILPREPGRRRRDRMRLGLDTGECVEAVSELDRLLVLGPLRRASDGLGSGGVGVGHALADRQTSAEAFWSCAASATAQCGPSVTSAIASDAEADKRTPTHQSAACRLTIRRESALPAGLQRAHVRRRRPRARTCDRRRHRSERESTRRPCPAGGRSAVLARPGMGSVQATPKKRQRRGPAIRCANSARGQANTHIIRHADQPQLDVFLGRQRVPVERRIAGRQRVDLGKGLGRLPRAEQGRQRWRR